MGECEHGEQGRVGSPAGGPPEAVVVEGMLRASTPAVPPICSHGWRT